MTRLIARCSSAALLAAAMAWLAPTVKAACNPPSTDDRRLTEFKVTHVPSGRSVTAKPTDNPKTLVICEGEDLKIQISGTVVGGTTPNRVGWRIEKEHAYVHNLVDMYVSAPTPALPAVGRNQGNLGVVGCNPEVDLYPKDTDPSFRIFHIKAFCDDISNCLFDDGDAYYEGGVPVTIIEIDVVVLKVDLTARRPCTEGPEFDNPFDEHVIPEDKEESPGAGIRVNGDPSEGSNENDLIKVELKAEPFPVPSGVTCVLKRSNSSIKVWDSRTMGTAILDSGTEATITFSAATKTVWVENPAGGSADLELIARSGSTDVCSDKIHFYDFTTVVIALGGLGQVPTDPVTPALPDTAHPGVFELGRDLYLAGYDAHIYNENTVTLDGQGVPYEEVVSAIQNRGVTRVVIYGYSRGGGATFDLADELNDNSAAIGSFTLSLTAYIDAVSSLSAAQENRRPTGSALHINYFQEGVWWPLSDPFYDDGLDGGPIDTPAPGDPPEVNVDAGGQTITHYAIDDHPPALNAIRNGVLALPR